MNKVRTELNYHAWYSVYTLCLYYFSNTLRIYFHFISQLMKLNIISVPSSHTPLMFFSMGFAIQKYFLTAKLRTEEEETKINLIALVLTKNLIN